MVVFVVVVFLVLVVVILLVLNCAQLQKRSKVRLPGFLVGLMVILDGFCNSLAQDLFLLLLRHLEFGFWR
ncbi:transmembrane protein, putative [Medicago truncatula]|uniref:Transmembrane protein, putative n=1 Tax=Medicago truncatula TaxID=3880 RepID=A0A072TLU7_MEDTR|nr:transmembrane protein, putative [Medicago truncatula]